jgi:5-methylcytosine-specific restriction endonuclease McrA
LLSESQPQAPPPSEPADNATAPPIHRTSRPTLAPLSAERYKIQFTASRQLHDKLRRAQDLLRQAIPGGDPAAIFERGLDLLLAQVERQKLGQAAHPRVATRTTRHSRHIPAAVKRDVWIRDQARCAFVGVAGRCTERGFLELHHVHPYADGGSSASAANIELRCRAHNA